MEPYKQRKDSSRVPINERYIVQGYIAAGTYGKVYKAIEKSTQSLVAIKKFKNDAKDTEPLFHTGVTQSAIREMSLCRELQHKHVSRLMHIHLERKCVYMVFEYAEHDLLQVIHYHSHAEVPPLPLVSVKSILSQLLHGLAYLHENRVLHRDLKPANIMVSADGVVKIGDLGLARSFADPLNTLYAGDKVVVTIWYRAPELLLGARHYTPAVDLWAVGCILGELISLRPLFKGEETKMEITGLNQKKHTTMPFQENQFLKIIQVLGTPTLDEWPSLQQYPEWQQLGKFTQFPKNLHAWYANHCNYPDGVGPFKLLEKLLIYDPLKRVSAEDAILDDWFFNEPNLRDNVFVMRYPKRKIHKGDSDL
ncbi:hypothetical protein CANINC_000653 [Pichia inconspicua]|uniref:Cyclin-dependent kinase 8 n=1 Tax=Pichia inconspicua TaxID=52247 RepID=A0A4T0X6P8_9ASCO|nr:hypothetical protein CANINC_000653 [[Candida] inconspicua]